ncbi:hypothetical protein ACCI51_09330 [Microbulbifer echini]|uniref:Uncharacterized protein n=1 Tax=Microbulbifer echini TaxID=1529067 RepID=A0ABV4NMY6_9GAMM
MALCRESYKLREDLVDLSSLKSIFETNTGLEIDLEVCDKVTTFVHCDKFNSSIEIEFNFLEKEVFIYTSPKKKGYFEYALLYSLSPFLLQKIDVPEYAKRKWKDLGFFEKFFKK